MTRWMVAIVAMAAFLPVTARAQDSDLAPVPASEAGYGTKVAPPADGAPPAAPADTPPADAVPAAGDTATAAPADAAPGATPAVPPGPGCVPGPSVAGPGGTYGQQDVLGAAERTFGKGAEGLAKTIEKIFKDNGRPNAYIAGREAGGAIVVGLRYGSGTMTHNVEGNCPVFWTGPSLGFDFGANGSKVFVLVYNLYDTKDLYHRFGAIEGQVYVIGGFTFSYLRRGDIVLVPVRLGVGLRLGANVGYMKFSEKSKWLPF
jgi:hypothetical protein